MVNDWKVNIVLLLFLFSFSALAITNTVDVNGYNIAYDYNGNDAIVGEKFNLGVTVTNLQSTIAEDIRFELEDSERINVIGDEEFELDSLNPGESVRRTFKIRSDYDIREDTYSLDFEITADSGIGRGEFDIEIISVTPELRIGNIQVLPTILTADLEDVKLTLTVENIGDGDANFVNSKLNLPGGFTPSNSYSDRANLGIIKEGEQKSATFFIDTDKYVQNGIHKGELFLEYEDESGLDKTERIMFDLPIKGKPLLEVVGVDTYPEVYPGSSVQLGITLQNYGTEDGEETSIRVFENSDLPFSFDEKTNFIGTLKPEESGRGIFTLNIDDNAEVNKYLLKIQMRTVNNGDVMVFEETVQIPVIKKETDAMSLLYKVFIGFLVVSIILGGIIIWKLKEKKKKRELRKKDKSEIKQKR